MWHTIAELVSSDKKTGIKPVTSCVSRYFMASIPSLIKVYVENFSILWSECWLAKIEPTTRFERKAVAFLKEWLEDLAFQETEGRVELESEFQYPLFNFAASARSHPLPSQSCNFDCFLSCIFLESPSFSYSQGTFERKSQLQYFFLSSSPFKKDKWWPIKWNSIQTRSGIKFPIPFEAGA